MTGLAVFAAILFFGSEFKKRSLAEALSPTATLPWKGFFILWVFLSHFGNYAPLESVCGKHAKIACGILGQLMVAPFLFFSGYGIMESVRKKGAAYLYAFPRRRMLKTLVHFDAAVALFAVAAAFSGNCPRPAKIALAMTGWESIGNSNWYIFAVLCFYAAAFASLRPRFDPATVLEKPLARICLAAALVGLYAAAMILAGKQDYWWNTAFCFPTGMAASVLKDDLSRFVGNGSGCFWIPFAGLVGFVWFGRIPVGPTLKWMWPPHLETPVMAVAFVLLLALFSTRVRIGNRVLDWCGEHLFGIYILQRLPMNALKDVRAVADRPAAYFAICFVVTLLLASVFDRATAALDKKLGLK